MRNVPKGPAPQILVENRQAWSDAFDMSPTINNRDKYKHPEIKAALKAETHCKCVYCESKIGHNCPGDIEHKLPKAKRADLLFSWENMTIACSECNRRKRDYYDPDCVFLDPNSDDVEILLIHLGPLVFSMPGHLRSEVTVRTLELDRPDRRRQLLARKFERLEDIRNLCERIAGSRHDAIKKFLLVELQERCSPSAEFSAMIKAFVDGLPENWTDDVAEDSQPVAP